MKLNRRNVLLGLGTIVAGGGGALATGAFSSVEADRTVSVETAGDDSAFLQLSGDGDYVTDDNGDTLTLDLGQATAGDGFNENAVTTVEGVVTVTNNAADGQGITVGFGNPDSQSGTTTVHLDDASDAALADITFSFDSDSPQTISDGGSASIDVEVDTRDPTGGDGQTADITISAT